MKADLLIIRSIHGYGIEVVDIHDNACCFDEYCYFDDMDEVRECIEDEIKEEYEVRKVHYL